MCHIEEGYYQLLNCINNGKDEQWKLLASQALLVVKRIVTIKLRLFDYQKTDL